MAKDAGGHGSDAQNATAAAALAGGHPKSVGVPVHPQAVTLQSAIAGFNSAAGKWAQGIIEARSKVPPLSNLKSAADMNAEQDRIWSRK
jgi:hypothetical protein